MGILTSSLLRLDLRGNRLTRFPLAVTQLVALRCLDASCNDFAELPAAITALSRLTDLRFGRYMSCEDQRRQLYEKYRLDVRALGDLSGFPALEYLVLTCCEFLLCRSILGAVRHACLADIGFCHAQPAAECEQVVLQLEKALQLRKALGRIRRDSMASTPWAL